jgi:hypothetical protein
VLTIGALDTYPIIVFAIGRVDSRNSVELFAMLRAYDVSGRGFV